MKTASLIGIAACLMGQAEEKNADKWLAYYKQAASRYEVSIEVQQERQKLPMADAAVMRWVSLEKFSGAVFVRSHNGRPALFTAVLSFPQNGAPGRRRVVHEFASVSGEQLSVAGPNDRIWRPKSVEKLTPIPDAPEPASARRLRRLQCRRLARAFSAHLVRLEERWELRLMAKPLVEYEGGSDDVLGGAVFAFAGYVTDPEILLLIEARRTPQGPRWHYLPVRFSDKSLFLSYKKKAVWESLRKGHGGADSNTADPQYRVLASESVPVDAVLSGSAGPPQQPR